MKLRLSENNSSPKTKIADVCNYYFSCCYIPEIATELILSTRITAFQNLNQHWTSTEPGTEPGLNPALNPALKPALNQDWTQHSTSTEPSTEISTEPVLKPALKPALTQHWNQHWRITWCYSEYAKVKTQNPWSTILLPISCEYHLCFMENTVMEEYSIDVSIATIVHLWSSIGE